MMRMNAMYEKTVEMYWKRARYSVIKLHQSVPATRNLREKREGIRWSGDLDFRENMQPETIELDRIGSKLKPYRRVVIHGQLRQRARDGNDDRTLTPQHDMHQHLSDGYIVLVPRWIVDGERHVAALLKLLTSQPKRVVYGFVSRLVYLRATDRGYHVVGWPSEHVELHEAAEAYHEEYKFHRDRLILFLQLWKNRHVFMFNAFDVWAKAPIMKDRHLKTEIRKNCH